ncbi:MAG TPA: glycosyltransferase, partial [Clostridia bacterium]|nr:glycosyltransferase [Clostridia bacterium]
PRYPRVSVVVASYNGDRTLKACLDSLRRLNYPDYEVILVDDGSTDTTPQIAFMNSDVRCIRHERNLGLSAARNTGIGAATGEVIAFTDADCRADENWLYYLVGELLRTGFAAMGGPNLFPPEDSAVAAAVMVSPGGPAHVMLNDREAEHIPGCNMAFLRSALVAIGGFDPVFRVAGDDVDVCWRLDQAGYKIGFSPSAFVWHYRRSTIRAYLKQQRGYGEAEALLVRKHPEYFNSLGGSMWRGRIYAGARFGVQLRPSIIYRGLFGSAGFQALYTAEPSTPLMWCTTLEYHLLVTLPLWILAGLFNPFLPLAITSVLLSLGLCAAAGAQAVLPPRKKHWWSKPLVGLLFFLQPIIRGWARYRGRLSLRPDRSAPQPSLDSVSLRGTDQNLDVASYWSEQPVDRVALVSDILRRVNSLGWPHKSDIGWSDYDVEVYGNLWTVVQLVTVSEDHPRGRQMIRCRLRGRWSLQAKVTFWGLVAVECLLLGHMRGTTPALWLLLLLLPLLAWFLHREKRDLQSILLVFLDQVAKDWNLVRVKDSEPSPTVQTAAGPTAKVAGEPATEPNPPISHPGL